MMLFQLAFLSCKKSEVEPLFPESANQRATNAVAGYKKQLTDAQYGWKGVYYPDGGKAGGYSFYLKFDATGKLSMYSDIDGFYYFSNGYDKAFETTFQVKALQKPTLIFDSYSYLHELVNPDYNGGSGRLADLELEFATVTEDKITLIGNINKTEMTLTKVTKIESDLLAKGGLASVFKGTSNFVSTPKFIILTFPTGEKTDVVIDLGAKQLALYFVNAKNEPDLVSSAFSVTATGIQLKDPIKLYGVTFQELFWDDVKKIYYLNVGGKRIDLTYSSKPALPFYYALGNLFQSFIMSPSVPTQSTEFKALYDKIKSNVITLSTAPPVRVLGNISLQYQPDNGVFALFIDYTRTETNGTVVFNGAGVLFYQPTLDSRGNIKFTRLASNGTYYYDFDQFLSGNISGIVLTGIKPLTDVLENNTFQWDYDPVVDRTAVLKSTGTPSITIKGVLF